MFQLKLPRGTNAALDELGPNHHRTTPELFKPKPPEGIEGPARMQEMGTYEYQI